MVIIINGKGGCGKTTLIDGVKCVVIQGNYHYVRDINTNDCIKQIARHGGWKNDKSNAGRKLLHDLQKAFHEYNGLPLNMAMNEVKFYTEVAKAEPICFVHIREPENIETMVQRFKSENIPVTTMLIKEDITSEHTYGNPSDDDVEKYDYEHIFENNADIDKAKDSFKESIRKIVKAMLYSEKN